jgi:hypothetical protein
MSDVFTRLIQRALGIADGVVPRLPGLFESVDAPPEPTWDRETEGMPKVVRTRGAKPPVERSELPVDEPPPQGPRAEVHFRIERPPASPDPIHDPMPAAKEPTLVPDREARKAETPQSRSPRPNLTLLVEEILQTAPGFEKAPGDPGTMQETEPADAEPRLMPAGPHDPPPARRPQRPSFTMPEPLLQVRGPAPVQVRIGRIEVKSASVSPPHPSPRPRTARSVALTLHDYLAGRGRG